MPDKLRRKEDGFVEFLGRILQILDTGMPKPQMYGWFHLLWFAISIVAGILLCRFFKEGTEKQARTVVLVTAVSVIVLEVYKMINYTFTYEDGKIIADFQWYAFPFQFCSTSMYVGLLAGLTKKGKVHSALCAYLATFAVFAGACVMFYPVSVFISTIGINIQTMICHGSMLSVGIYLLYTGYVKIEHKTILKALPVYAVAVGLAVIMNELAHQSGLLERETFNMFFISPYCEPSLPVYSLVQAVVPFPWCLLIYIGGFTAGSYVILLLAMLIKRVAKTCGAKSAKAVAIAPQNKEAEKIEEEITV